VVLPQGVDSSTTPVTTIVTPTGVGGPPGIAPFLPQLALALSTGPLGGLSDGGVGQATPPNLVLVQNLDQFVAASLVRLTIFGEPDPGGGDREIDLAELEVLVRGSLGLAEEAWRQLVDGLYGVPGWLENMDTPEMEEPEEELEPAEPAPGEEPPQQPETDEETAASAAWLAALAAVAMTRKPARKTKKDLLR
jgi:hypothetical protein